MAFKMKGFRAKRSPLKVEDYDALTEDEKEELYYKIIEEEKVQDEEQEAKKQRLKMHRPKNEGAY